MSLINKRRRALLAAAHQGAKALGLDEDARREAQEAVTGCASCRDMSDAQLVKLCWHYKDRGAPIGVPAPRPKGGSGANRPTQAGQLAEIERLALAHGWAEGLEDGRLRAFVQRTAGADDIRWLSKSAATKVIAGLRRWLKQKEATNGCQ